MLTDFTGADRVIIACGRTDLMLGIDGLAALVKQQFRLDPFTNTLFLFCGRRWDRIKALKDFDTVEGYEQLYAKLQTIPGIDNVWMLKYYSERNQGECCGHFWQRLWT